VWYAIGWTGLYGGWLYTAQSSGELVPPTIESCNQTQPPTQAAGYHPPAGGQNMVTFTNVVPDSHITIHLDPTTSGSITSFTLAPDKVCKCGVSKLSLFHRVEYGLAHLLSTRLHCFLEIIMRHLATTQPH